jgi:hypothetical protein
LRRRRAGGSLSDVLANLHTRSRADAAVGDHWEYRITDNLRLGLVTMLEADVYRSMPARQRCGWFTTT